MGWRTKDGTCACPMTADNPAIEPLIISEDLFVPMMVVILSFSLSFSCMIRFLVSEYTLARKKTEEGMLSFTWEEQFSYRLDYYLSSNKWAKPSMLLSGTSILIFFGAVLLSLTSHDNLYHSTWRAWTYVADPGTHADAEGTMVRLVSFLITVGGMVVFAMMIQLISDALGEKVDDLKKGTSRVMESDHTLMLGWSDKSIAIIQQVALANESEGGGTIVVLAENDKQEMENSLMAAMNSGGIGLDLKGTQVVFRSGNPLLEYDLRKVSVLSARSIIALSYDNEDADQTDSRMVRQVLSLKAFENLKSHVVVELQDIDNKILIDLVATDMTEVVVSHDIIGRLMIQCAREPGLAYVLEALMGFDGDEFYIEYWPELVGLTFYEITCRFDDAVPVGVKKRNGEILINPDNSFIIEEGTRILCLAEDNDSYTVNDGEYNITPHGPPINRELPNPSTEKLLFCGWRRDLADMITQLDEFVLTGSELWLLNTVPVKDRYELLMDKGNKEELSLKNISIKNVVGNHTIRRDLNLLAALDYDGHETGETITLDEFDSVLILADAVTIEHGFDMQSTDSRSLASMLIIQDIQKKNYLRKSRMRFYEETHPPAFPISEILDARTRNLLNVIDCKGFVMSNQIIAAAIAQISEDRDMNVVLGVLLSAEGSETYIRSISCYVDLNKETQVSFWAIALRARQLNEVVIGYKPEEMSYVEANDMLLNPPNKSQPRKWSEGDVMIVIAED